MSKESYKIKLRTADILVWLADTHPDVFVVADVMEQYGLARGEAQRRINYMHYIWGAVRRIGLRKSEGPGRKVVEYAVTKWGKTYAEGRKGQ